MNFFIMDNNDNLIESLTSKEISQALIDEKLNSYDELTLAYTQKSEDLKDPKQVNTIVFKDTKGWREYIIREIEDSNDGTTERQIKADLSSIELIDEIVKNNLSGATNRPEMVLSLILDGTRWEVGDVDPAIESKTFSRDIQFKNVLESIDEVLAEYNAEVTYTYELIDNRIKRRFVNLHKQAGQDKGKRFEWNKDLKKIVRLVDRSSIRTALILRGNEQDDGSRTNIEKIEWNKAAGDPVDKPLGQDWIGHPEALEEYGKLTADGNKRHRFDKAEFNVNAPESLIILGWDELEKLIVPKTTYEAEAIDLYKITQDEDLKHEYAQIGDSVAVIDKDLNITVKRRVVEAKRDLLTPINNSFVFGDPKDYFNNNDELDEQSKRITRLEDAVMNKEEEQEVFLYENPHVYTPERKDNLARILSIKSKRNTQGSHGTLFETGRLYFEDAETVVVTGGFSFDVDLRNTNYELSYIPLYAQYEYKELDEDYSVKDDTESGWKVDSFKIYFEKANHENGVMTIDRPSTLAKRRIRRLKVEESSGYTGWIMNKDDYDQLKVLYETHAKGNLIKDPIYNSNEPIWRLGVGRREINELFLSGSGMTLPKITGKKGKLYTLSFQIDDSDHVNNSYPSASDLRLSKMNVVINGTTYYFDDSFQMRRNDAGYAARLPQYTREDKWGVNDMTLKITFVAESDDINIDMRVLFDDNNVVLARSILVRNLKLEELFYDKGWNLNENDEEKYEADKAESEQLAGSFEGIQVTNSSTMIGAPGHVRYQTSKGILINKDDEASHQLIYDVRGFSHSEEYERYEIIQRLQYTHLEVPFKKGKALKKGETYVISFDLFTEGIGGNVDFSITSKTGASHFRNLSLEYGIPMDEGGIEQKVFILFSPSVDYEEPRIFLSLAAHQAFDWDGVTVSTEEYQLYDNTETVKLFNKLHNLVISDFMITKGTFIREWKRDELTELKLGIVEGKYNNLLKTVEQLNNSYTSTDVLINETGHAQTEAKTVNVSFSYAFQERVDPEKRYFIFLQPRGNTRMWPSDVTIHGFTANSDSDSVAFDWKVEGYRREEEQGTESVVDGEVVIGDVETPEEPAIEEPIVEEPVDDSTGEDVIPEEPTTGATPIEA